MLFGTDLKKAQAQEYDLSLSNSASLQTSAH